MSADTSLGISIRPAGEQDAPDLVRILNAEYDADGIDKRLTVEAEREWRSTRSERFDARRDVRFAELDGRAVGVAVLNWADSRDGTAREYRVWGAVEPASRRLGIGAALLADNERRAAALARTHNIDLPRVLRGYGADGRPARRILERAGFTPEGYLFDMVRPSLDEVPELPLPPGLSLRPVTRDQCPAIWRATIGNIWHRAGGAARSRVSGRALPARAVPDQPLTRKCATTGASESAAASNTT